MAPSISPVGNSVIGPIGPGYGGFVSDATEPIPDKVSIALEVIKADKGATAELLAVASAVLVEYLKGE